MAVRAVLRGVVKRYPRFELRVDSLTLETGLYALVGPNGSGKSVLLRLLAGLTRPSRGSIEYVVDGRRVPATLMPSMVGLVAADVRLPNWPVERILSYFLGVPPARARTIAREYMLAGYEDKKYEELSSGYKKRVQAVLGFEIGSRVLLLDEPFINVDSEYVGFLEERILAAARDRLVVVATHVPTRILEHNLILIRDGRILYMGRVPGLLSKLVTVRLKDGRELPIDEALGICGLRGEPKIKSLQEVLSHLAG